MKELEQKYIDLLLKRCMNFEKSNYLFIDYDIANQSFVDKIKKTAEEMDLDVYLNKNDIYEKRDFLLNATEEDVKSSPMFDASHWDDYAKKNAGFLMLASEFPGVLDEVDPKLLALGSKLKQKSKPLYKKMQLNGELVWLIAVYPNKVWAKEKFPDLDEDEAYKKLFNLMMEVTMCTKDDPIESWNNQLNNQSKMMKKLNNLKIKKLHFTNRLGTDIYISLSDKAKWQSAGENNNETIVNMPSYEVFTSPDCHLTEGVVYSSKPLMYNGSLIDEFWVQFKDGKVIDFDAKKGKDLLKEIIEEDKGTCRLGEVALVDKNTPIAKTNFVFGETCLDENAACHIALGEGFPECIEGAIDMSDEEKEEVGLNVSKNHVDFMIGTEDLDIKAETENETLMIFKNGEFVI